MKTLRDQGRRLVDARVGAVVHGPRDVVLALRVRDDLLVLEHQDVAVEELIVRRRAAQSAFLSAVSSVRVPSVLEIELDLVETFFTHKILAAACAVSKVPSVDDGVDELARVALEVAAALDPSDALEAEAVPDLAGRHVRLVHQVEDRVGVAELRGPVQVALAEEATDTSVPGGIRDDEAGVAHVAAAPRVVGLDVEEAEAFLGPVFAIDHVFGRLDVPQQHDGAKVLEPVGGKLVEGQPFHHGIGIPALDLLVQLIIEVAKQRVGNLVPRRKREDGGYRLPVPERDVSGSDADRQSRVRRVGKRRLTGDTVDGRGIRVVQHSRHRGNICLTRIHSDRYDRIRRQGCRELPIVGIEALQSKN